MSSGGTCSSRSSSIICPWDGSALQMRVVPYSHSMRQVTSILAAVSLKHHWCSWYLLLLLSLTASIITRCREQDHITSPLSHLVTRILFSCLTQECEWDKGFSVHINVALWEENRNDSYVVLECQYYVVIANASYVWMKQTNKYAVF
jgi:hypothetical protein